MDIQREILIEAGHRCAVCGVPCPLEQAHIIPWHQSKEHKVKDLICLCANCHQRADHERWGEKTLREYKERPWVMRQHEYTVSAPKLKTRLELMIKMEMEDFNEAHQTWLQYALAAFLDIPPGDVQIALIERGSLKASIELPARNTDELLNALKGNDPLLEQLVCPLVIETAYRVPEVHLIVKYALRGESLGFVSVSGVGKSNLINFLRNIRRKDQQVEQDVEQLYFPVVDATYWEGTAASLWKMMLDALVQATKEIPPSSENDKAIPISEEERVLNTLRARLQWLCHEQKLKIMFVLDDFDAVFETGQLAIHERLNRFRSEGNRGYLSYLVFTKRLPHILGRGYDIENKSRFYDLFRHSLYALEPYTSEDSR